MKDQMMQEPMMQEPMPEEEVEPGSEAATPEEEAILDEAFLLAQELIYAPGQSGDQIAELIKGSQDISQGIGKATATVLMAVEKRAGGLDDAVKMQLGQMIIAEFAEMAVEYGALSAEEVDDSFIDAVVSHAYSEYMTMKEAMGQLDPAELEANVAEAEQMAGQSARQPQQPAPQEQPSGGLLGMA